MAKVKISKKSTRIDMTAMCDVAFLLLSFFIMTATAKVPEPKPVDSPSSTVKDKLPDRNLATITIGDSAIYFGVSDRDLRKAMLEEIMATEGLTFTKTQIKEFEKIEQFGVPFDELGSLLDAKAADRNKEGVQKGIPYKDSTDNQLAKWVVTARQLAFEKSRKRKDKPIQELKVAIKGDSKEKYPVVKKLFDILQAQEVNNFFLVTNLRDENF
jgi:biopolymer transport protein ExbD